MSSPTANAAGTTGALGCSEASAWVSSKSSEWPSAPLSSAATAGVQVLLSPNTVASPVPSSASASSIFNSDGVDSASRRARTALPRKSSVRIFARSSTSCGISANFRSATQPASVAVSSAIGAVPVIFARLGDTLHHCGLQYRSVASRSGPIKEKFHGWSSTAAAAKTGGPASVDAPAKIAGDRRRRHSRRVVVGSAGADRKPAYRRERASRLPACRLLRLCRRHQHGGIIAAGVATGMSVADILAFYVSNGANMFEKARLVDGVRLLAQYQSEPLAEQLRAA